MFRATRREKLSPITPKGNSNVVRNSPCIGAGAVLAGFVHDISGRLSLNISEAVVRIIVI